MGDYLLVTDTRLTGKLTDLKITVGASPATIATAALELYIGSAEEEINNRLRSTGYGTIPATNANDEETFADKLAEIVAVRVWAETKYADDAPFKIKLWLENWKLFLSDLAKGNIILEGHAPATTQAGVLTVGSATFRSQTWTDADLIDEDFYG